ncbi:MAG: tetratricopeptide repeat protein [Kofleriaceae bacterium]
MALARRPLWVAAVGLALAPGCFWATTKSEGRALRRDIDALDSRVATKEGELDVQITELKRVLEDATALLKRNSADLGADVEALRGELRSATGMVAAMQLTVDEAKAASARLEERLAALEARLTALEGKGPTTPPVAAATADSLWNTGKVAFEAGRFDDARAAFAQLVRDFPNSDRADDAQYFRGEAFFKEGKHDEAIREYQRVFDKYASSSLADDALFRAAEAATALKNCSEARAYYGLLQQKYASSSLVKKAAANEKTLAGQLKNKAKCTS